MAILLRQVKGSELTFAEVDNNFSTLLFDVQLSGTDLLFYSNNGVNVLKRTIDLSNILSSALTVQISGVNVTTDTSIINFEGDVQVIQTSPGVAKVTVAAFGTSSGTSGSSGSRGSSGSSGSSGS